MVWLEELPPTRFSDDLAIRAHGAPSYDRAHDLPAEFAAKVGAHAALRLKVFRSEGPALLGVYDREVGVGTHGDRALARVQAEKLGRGGGGEMRDPLERQPAGEHAVGHEDRQRGLNARDTTPGLPDIVLALLLGGGRAGGMIGANRVHSSSQHLMP